MNARRVTLAEIARKAGVHVTTVSLAMRNHPRLPEATRERIRTLAAEMGYVPDPVLRALVTYRASRRPRFNPPTLAYVTNWNTRWGWREVLAHPDFYDGAEAKAKELGFKLEHFWMREPGLTHGRLSGILQARGIGGLVIASHVREIDAHLDFDWASFSAVKIDYFPHEPKLNNVTNHHLQIIRLAMQKAMAAGYRRIGCVMDEGWDITVDRIWSAGFLWEQQSLPSSARIPIHLLPSRVSLETWIRRHRPEVILTKTEFVMPALRKLGLRVPEDVALIDLFLDDVSGSTAGIRQNYRAVGEAAIELLAAQIQHNKVGIPEIPTTTYVEGTWVPGASCPGKP